ncbi:hypothetical protein [Actinoplanes teichomyceticus]|uniref:Tight adherence protein B n=1 Tax=Actinoplanes teichomyceticus TaxID=1867 RepID=A0A561WS62_ACTTI|nr:hypothetical protein [Actinoplanes teichomyceticus]TWG26710.1 tight adherence protein B [Actinoplanes teichomyceticus]GIF15110.1 hypothetical protein Ate01nite_51420 [Actinoplanes teichomyceticus]
MIAVLIACLAGCTVVIAWPGARVLARLSAPGDRPAIDLRRMFRVPTNLVAAPGRRAVGAVAGVAALAGLLLGGPVAALVGAVYAGLATAEWARRVARKRVAAGRAASLDGLAALVADLRAGLPPVLAASSAAPAGSLPAASSPSAWTDRALTALSGREPSVRAGWEPGAWAGPEPGGWAGPEPGGWAGPEPAASAGSAPAGAAVAGPGDGRIARLTEAVWRLAEHTGAPAADLLERIEADARAADRAAASAAAQAAGAQATALLLAGLPVGGIGLGYAIGADPLQILLRTPVGAACAVAAVLLQCGGLRWAQRLVDGPR